MTADEIRAIRRRVGMSQPQFAEAFSFTLGSVRDWEQGRRQPEQAARVLLLVIDANPEVVRDAVRRGIRRLA